MSNNGKNSSLSNMLRERKGENDQQTSREEDSGQFPSWKSPDRSIRTTAPVDNDSDASRSGWKKNTLIFVICIVLPVLSYYDYIDLPFFGSADDGTTAEIVNDFEEGFQEGYNEARVERNNEGIITPYNEYMEKLNSGELGKTFKSWEIDHLYKSSVPLSFLEGLQQGDLINRLEFWEISTLVTNEVTTEYLRALDQAGLFSKWEAWEIGNLYEDGVPVSFLSSLSQDNLLASFSSDELSTLFASGITADELLQISGELNLDEVSVDEILERR